MNKDLEDLYYKYLFNTSLDDIDKSKIDIYMLSLCLFRLFLTKYTKYKNNSLVKSFLKTIIIPGIRFNNTKRLDNNKKDSLKLLQTFSE